MGLITLVSVTIFWQYTPMEIAVPGIDPGDAINQ